MSTRVAVIGAGAMVREHVRAFAAVADVAIAGIYSRTRAGRRHWPRNCTYPRFVAPFQSFMNAPMPTW